MDKHEKINLTMEVNFNDEEKHFIKLMPIFVTKTTLRSILKSNGAEKNN